MLHGSCRMRRNKKQNRLEDVKEKDSESTLKTDVADFCSDIELFMASFDGYLASLTGDATNPDEEMKKMAIYILKSQKKFTVKK